LLSVTSISGWLISIKKNWAGNNFLNQQGKKVHLWKISYEKTKENTLAKLVIVEAKVAGFWLQ